MNDYELNFCCCIADFHHAMCGAKLYKRIEWQNKKVSFLIGRLCFLTDKADNLLYICIFLCKILTEENCFVGQWEEEGVKRGVGAVAWCGGFVGAKS